MRRLFALFFLLFLPLGYPLAAEDRLLVFGRVQDDPVRATRDRQGFVDYIAQKLAPLGFTGGRLLIVGKVGQLAAAVRDGKVDLFHDSVVPTMVLSKWARSIPLLRQWKFQESDYYSVIVVRKDSGINSLTDLKGNVIAFDEPHSTSAHILPRMLLTEKKLKLVPLAPTGVDRGAVNFIHSSDDNAPYLVSVGKVDAASTSHREFQVLRPEIREQLKIIAETRSVPRQIISVRRDLDPKIVASLRELLVNMDKTSEGQAALKAQQNTTKFDEIPPQSFDHLKEIEKFIFSTLGKQIDSW
jgi:phosphonate transport system substrate-binding protein